MTREELTARIRKLTGKTATDIEALDERVDALEAGAGGGGTELKYVDKVVNKTDLIQTTGNNYNAQISFEGSFTNPIIVNTQLVSNMGVDLFNNSPIISVNTLDSTVSQFIDAVIAYADGQGMIGMVTVNTPNLAQLQDSFKVRVWYYEAPAET